MKCSYQLSQSSVEQLSIEQQRESRIPKTEKGRISIKSDMFQITATMPSLADKTRISAHETTSGHSLSTASLMVSRYLKFLSPKLLSVSFSDKLLLVESNSNEASHDYTKDKTKQN